MPRNSLAKCIMNPSFIPAVYTGISQAKPPEAVEARILGADAVTEVPSCVVNRMDTLIVNTVSEKGCIDSRGNASGRVLTSLSSTHFRDHGWQAPIKVEDVVAKTRQFFGILRVWLNS